VMLSALVQGSWV